MKQSGIYRIVNKINGKGYVGSAVDTDRREYQHLRELKLNIHHSPRLQNAWNKYGENNFIFEVLEIVENPTKKKLEAKEQIWMDKLQGYDRTKGYNIRKIAESNLGIIQEERGTTKRIKQEILDFCKINGHKPTYAVEDTYGINLGHAINNYLTTGYCKIDRDFEREVNAFPTFKEFRKQQLISEILDFINEYKFLPSRNSKNKKEHTLRLKIDRFISPSTDMYDKEIVKLLKNTPSQRRYKTQLIKKEVLKFVRKYGHIPCRYSKDMLEKNLAVHWNLFSSKNDSRYDKKLVDVIRKFPCWSDFVKTKKEVV